MIKPQKLAAALEPAKLETPRWGRIENVLTLSTTRFVVVYNTKRPSQGNARHKRASDGDASESDENDAEKKKKRNRIGQCNRGRSKERRSDTRER